MSFSENNEDDEDNEELNEFDKNDEVYDDAAIIHNDLYN